MTRKSKREIERAIEDLDGVQELPTLAEWLSAPDEFPGEINELMRAQLAGDRSTRTGEFDRRER